MNYLLDTNIFLWWLGDDKRLKDSIKQIINSQDNKICVSVVSCVEISIKHRIGKLPLKTTIKEIFEISDLNIISIDLDHGLALDELPLHKTHKDPFDRMLVCQAKVEGLTLITHDPKIWKYKIKLIKA